jgi:hypothetical protein
MDRASLDLCIQSVMECKIRPSNNQLQKKGFYFLKLMLHIIKKNSILITKIFLGFVPRKVTQRL